MSSEEEGPVAWLRQRIRERLYLAQHAIELGNAAEWTELSSGVLMTVAPDAPQDRLDGVHPLGDSSLTRLMEANDPRDTIARCEAELAILDEHALTWPDGQPEYEHLDESVTDSRGGVHYMPVKGDLIPPYTCRICGYDDGRPCMTVSLLAGGYRHWPGYREEDWRA
jgi:hypothetical protein